MNLKTPSKNEQNLDIAFLQQSILRGDTAPFEKILDVYEKPTMKLIGFHVPSQDVQEVAQDTFLQLYRGLRSNYKDQGKFWPYLKRIATRACCAYWRRQYKNREQSLSSLGEHPEGLLDSLLSVKSGEAYRESEHQRELEELLGEVLGSLSVEDRMVLELVYFQGLSVKEAASRLEISYANAKIRSFRAKRRLKKQLLHLAKQGGR